MAHHHWEEIWYGKFPNSSLKAHSKSQFVPTLGLAIVVKNKNPIPSVRGIYLAIYIQFWFEGHHGREKVRKGHVKPLKINFDKL